MQIIYKASIFGNMFTRDSRKVLDIIKELTLETDAETWIRGLRGTEQAQRVLTQILESMGGQHIQLLRVK